MTVIDLGELRDDRVPEPSPRRPRPAARPYRGLVVLLVVLLTVAGGAPARARAAATVPARPGAAAFPVGNRLYLIEPRDPERGVGPELVAYRLAAASRPAVLWRASLPTGGDVVSLVERSGTVLLIGPTGGADGVYRTTGVDARTGRVVWRQPGVGFPVGAGLLLQSVDGDGVNAIRRVDLPSGRTLWSVPTPSSGVDLRFGPDGVDRIVLTPASGDVEVLDAVSGTRLAARDISPGELPTWQQSQVVDDLLLVVRDNGAALTAYGLDRLDRRWTVRLSLVGYLTRCGDLLCAYRQTGGMWVLDPATGATRWTDPRWQAVLRAADGRFLVAWADQTGSRYAVVEAATGRQLADLGAWELASGDQPDEPLIGIRRSPDGRLLVAELDVAAGPARVLDALPDAAGECQVGGAVLVCRRVAGGFGVWWLR